MSKCGICGFRARDIGHLGKHMWKKHPKTMAQKVRAGRAKPSKPKQSKTMSAGMRYCPCCGREL